MIGLLYNEALKMWRCKWSKWRYYAPSATFFSFFLITLSIVVCCCVFSCSDQSQKQSRWLWRLTLPKLKSSSFFVRVSVHKDKIKFVAGIRTKTNGPRLVKPRFFLLFLRFLGFNSGHKIIAHKQRFGHVNATSRSWYLNVICIKLVTQVKKNFKISKTIKYGYQYSIHFVNVLLNVDVFVSYFSTFMVVKRAFSSLN